MTIQRTSGLAQVDLEKKEGNDNRTIIAHYNLLINYNDKSLLESTDEKKDVLAKLPLLQIDESNRRRRNRSASLGSKEDSESFNFSRWWHRAIVTNSMQVCQTQLVRTVQITPAKPAKPISPRPFPHPSESESNYHSVAARSLVNELKGTRVAMIRITATITTTTSDMTSIARTSLWTLLTTPPPTTT